jgi:hypothetical protein
MEELKVGEGRKFSESCGLTKVIQDDREYYVVFGKLWPDLEEDHEGGVLGKGNTALEAMEDAILRLLEFRRGALKLDEVIERMQDVFKFGKGGGNYDSVLPIEIDEECGTDNAGIYFDEESRQYNIMIS